MILLKISGWWLFLPVACWSTICRKSIDMDVKQLLDDLEWEKWRNCLEACWFPCFLPCYSFKDFRGFQRPGFLVRSLFLKQLTFILHVGVPCLSCIYSLGKNEADYHRKSPFWPSQGHSSKCGNFFSFFFFWVQQ